MKLTLDCPKAQYDAEMRILCRAQGGAPCAHAHWMSCKGWWVLTDAAKTCPGRGERNERTGSPGR